MARASLLSVCGMPVARLALALACVATAAGAQGTWYVDAANPGCPGSGTPADPFCTIGAAVAEAAPGDTIEVAQGTYHESVVIAKDGLTLRGAGATVTTIVGSPVSHVVRPADFGIVADFTLEGFRLTSSAPDPGFVAGVWMDPTNVPGALWVVRGCLIEGVGWGVLINDAWGGAQALVEDTVIRNCSTGIQAYGDDVIIRRSTIVDIAGVGVTSPHVSKFEVSDSIIASIGMWAIQRYSGSQTTLKSLLIHDTNLNNPPNQPGAGPFMQYLAEGHPGGFGVWSSFTPSPGPILEADPLFVDAASGDVRLAAGSPAIDAVPVSSGVPSAPYDLLGSGHLRLDDGNFDGVAQVDLGAIEFGGLLLNGGLAGELAVGRVLTASQSGTPGAAFGLFAGLPGAPLDLGAKGTFFLAPAPMLLLTAGTLPAGGTVSVPLGALPAAAAGRSIAFQALQKSGSAVHWTNLEGLLVTP